MHAIEDITTHAIKSGLVKNPSVSFLAEGFGNENYLVKENRSLFVLRVKKKTESQFLDSLERENSFLKYFAECGLDFCPKALFYDAEDNFLIEDYIEGKLVAQKDFSAEQIDQFAQQLHELFSLDVQAFETFCVQNELKFFGYVSPIESLEQYGFNRFEEAKKGDLPKDVVMWVEERLCKNMTYLKNMEDKKYNRGFSWGDIQSKLIISNSGKMYFYDFEHVHIANSFGLSYIKIHGNLKPKQFDLLVERCAYYFKRSKEDLLHEIIANEMIVRTNDVVWAAMKWASTEAAEFKDLTYERMALAHDVGW